MTKKCGSRPDAEPNILPPQKLKRTSDSPPLGKQTKTKISSINLGPQCSELASPPPNTDDEAVSGNSYLPSNSSNSSISSISTVDMNIESNPNCEPKTFSNPETMSKPLTNAHIPPIFLLGFDWKKVTNKLIVTLLPNTILAKAHASDFVRTQCYDIELFKITQKYFTQQKVEYYTHTTQSNAL